MPGKTLGIAMTEETLKLAGRAVNLDVWFNHEVGSYGYGSPTSFTKWDPLRDDRDAFRLMVALKFSVRHNWNLNAVDVSGNVYHQPDRDERMAEFYGPESGQDPYTATRTAIVNAAATIGRYL